MAVLLFYSQFAFVSLAPTGPLENGTPTWPRTQKELGMLIVNATTILTSQKAIVHNAEYCLM